jgi:hypothetical protein
VCESTASSLSRRLSASDCMVCLDVDVVDCTTASESVYYVVIVEWRLKSSLEYSGLCLSAAPCVHIAFDGCLTRAYYKAALLACNVSNECVRVAEYCCLRLLDRAIGDCVTQLCKTGAQELSSCQDFAFEGVCSQREPGVVARNLPQHKNP